MLGHLNAAKLHDINICASEHFYIPGKSVYLLGNSADSIFLVKEGSLIMDTCLELDTYKRHPVAADQWLVAKETKTVTYRLRKVKEGEFFGHEEVLRGKSVRCTRVVAVGNAKVLRFESQDIERIFSEETREKMGLGMISIELAEIYAKI